LLGTALSRHLRQAVKGREDILDKSIRSGNAAFFEILNNIVKVIGDSGSEHDAVRLAQLPRD